MIIFFGEKATPFQLRRPKETKLRHKKDLNMNRPVVDLSAFRIVKADEPEKLTTESETQDATIVLS